MGQDVELGLYRKPSGAVDVHVGREWGVEGMVETSTAPQFGHERSFA